MHLSAPTHLPALLLSVVYAAALVVAATAPGQHALAGCVVLAGLVGLLGRTVAHRRRSTAAAVARSAAVVDAVLPEEGVAPAPATAA